VAWFQAIGCISAFSNSFLRRLRLLMGHLTPPLKAVRARLITGGPITSGRG